MNRLSYKLAFYAILAACIIVPLLSASTYYTTKLLLQKAVREKQVTLVQITLQRIDRALYSAYQGIQLIAENFIIESFLDQSHQGRSVSETSWNALNDEIFEELTILSGPWDSLSIVDQQGFIVASSHETMIGRLVFSLLNDKQAYNAAIEGNIYYSDVIFSKTTQKPTVLFAAPVYSENDPQAPILGAVIGHYSWGVVSQILTSVDAQNPIYLFNREGVIIAASRLVSHKILKESLSEHPLVQQALTGKSSDSAILPSIDFPGQEALSSYALQQGHLGLKGHGWGLLIEVSLNQALGPINQAIQYILGLNIFVALFVMFALYLLGRNFIAPIEKLTKNIQRVTEKELDHRVAVETDDEIGNLAQSFNQMLAHLNQTTVSKTYVDNIFTSMIDTLVVTTPDGTIQTVNQAALNLLGYQEEELIGKKISMFLSDAEIPPILQLLETDPSIRNATIQGKELFYLTNDGRYIPMLLSGVTLTNVSGNARGIVLVAQDISARKDAEETLQKQRELLQTTLASIGDGVITTDARGLVTFINPVAEQLTGWQQQEAFHRPIEDIFVIVKEGTRVPLENPVEKVLQEGHVVGLANHTILISKEGDEIPIDDSGSPIRGTSGHLQGAVLVFRDITERRNQEKRLHQAKEAAEAANIAKSQFLANMSHEIRTPLNAIVGFSQILLNRGRSHSLPPKFNHYLENIQSSGQHLSELINNILDLSKIESGKMDVSLEDMNIKQLLQSIYHINKPQALQKNLNFSYEWAPKLSTMIRSDRSKLNQILMNLTINAIKFTPSGKSVRLKMYEDNTQLVFDVIDEGIGIPKEKQTTIFEAFEQVDPTITRIQEGSGLGLAITKKLVDLLDGQIVLHSIPNEGSTFTVKVPLMIVHTQINGETLFPEDFSFSPENRIILIEDNPMNQEMAIEIFQDFGLKLETERNGMRGIQRVFECLDQGTPPDLILMDIHMPEMDGLTAIQKIRSNPEGQEIPIVVFSADAFKEQQKIAFSIGASDYLIKPLDFQKLFPVLAKYLHKTSETSETPIAQDLPPLSKDQQQELYSIFTHLSKISIIREGTIYEILTSIQSLCDGYEASYYLSLAKQLESTVAQQNVEEYQQLLEQGMNQLIDNFTSW